MKRFVLLMLCMCISLSQASFAQDTDCASIKESQKRLACYDSINRVGSAQKSKPKKNISQECKVFERKSNGIVNRFGIGFDSPDAYKGSLGEVLDAFGECVDGMSNPESNPKLIAYRRNVAAFKLTLDFWLRGIRECIKVSENFRSAGVASDCSWKILSPSPREDLSQDIAIKYPEIKLEGPLRGTYGYLAVWALRQVEEFH